LLFEYLKWFGQAFVAALPSLLLRLFVAWLFTFLVLLYSFRHLKVRVRARAVKVDTKAAHWALHLRYRNPAVRTGERVPLTWFFRFWTNFASSPSLSILSFFIPWWFVFLQKVAPGANAPEPPLSTSEIVRRTLSHDIELWMLPGLCFAGALLLSFILKRVYRRLRPPRPEGSFGHKMRDPSFPSGHSLTAFCFWVMLAVSTFAVLAVTPVTIMLALLALTIVALTGTSRIYMGVHYASDVLGGYTIALVWCIVCYLFLHGAMGTPDVVLR